MLKMYNKHGATIHHFQNTTQLKKAKSIRHELNFPRENGIPTNHEIQANLIPLLSIGGFHQTLNMHSRSTHPSKNTIEKQPC